MTVKSDSKDVIAGLESGSDDYLTKPVDHAALSARVRSMLRIKALHDTVQAQAQRLEEQATELAAGPDDQASAKCDLILGRFRPLPYGSRADCWHQTKAKRPPRGRTFEPAIYLRG